MEKIQEDQNNKEEMKDLIEQLENRDVPEDQKEESKDIILSKSEETPVPSQRIQSINENEEEKPLEEPKKKPGRPPGKKTTTTTPTKIVPETHVKNLFKGANKIYAFKVDPEGEEKFLRTYNIKELISYNSLEEFVVDNIVPKQGAGKYRLMIANPAKPQEYERIKDVDIQGVPPEIEKQSGFSARDFGDMMNTMLQIQALTKKDSDQQFDTIVKLMTLNKNKEDSKQDNSLLLILPLLMNQNKGPDPSTQMMITMMTKMMEKMEEKSSLPVLPPVPLPIREPEKEQKQVDVVELVRLVMEMNRQNQPEPQQQNQQLSDAIVTKFLEGKEDQEDKALDRLIKLKEFIKPEGEGLSEIDKLINSFTKMEEAKEKLFNKDSNLLESLTEIAASFVDKLPQQKQLPQQTQTRQPPIPKEIKKGIIGINKAVKNEDEKEIVNNFLKILVFLRQSNRDWAINFEEFLKHAYEGEEEEAMKVIEMFLNTFISKRLLKREIAEEVKDAFENNYNDILALFGFKQSEEDEEIEENKEEIVEENKIIETEDEDSPVDIEDIEKRQQEIQQKEQEKEPKIDKEDEEIEELETKNSEEHKEDK